MSRVQVVRFVVGARHFALDVMAVKEVIVAREAQAVPGQPSFVKGLVSLRGEYAPLIDLRERFHCEPSSAEPKILVLGCLRRELALLVDSVGEVQWLDDEDLRSAPMDTSVGGAPSVVSIADVDGTMVMLLRGESLLTDEEWSLVCEYSDPAR